MHLTELLHRVQHGDRDSLNTVIPLVYHDLKKLARSHLRREVRASSMETTVLVHEAFLRLAGGRQPSYENRAHFYGIASRLMRQVLVDMARARGAEKRAAVMEVAMADVPEQGLEADRSLLVLDDALRALGAADPRKAQFLEMRYFGGMTAEETAAAVAAPVQMVRQELRLALAWLRREIAGRSAASLPPQLKVA